MDDMTAPQRPAKERVGARPWLISSGSNLFGLLTRSENWIGIVPMRRMLASLASHRIKGGRG
jgi:hypothetical protein